MIVQAPCSLLIQLETPCTGYSSTSLFCPPPSCLENQVCSYLFTDAEGAIIRYNYMIRKTTKSRRPQNDLPGHNAVHYQTLLFTFYPTTSDSHAGEPSPLSGILQQYQISYMLDYRHRLSRLMNVERPRALGQIVESGRFFFDIDSLSDILKQ